MLLLFFLKIIKGLKLLLLKRKLYKNTCPAHVLVCPVQQMRASFLLHPDSCHRLVWHDFRQPSEILKTHGEEKEFLPLNFSSIMEIGTNLLI